MKNFLTNKIYKEKKKKSLFKITKDEFLFINISNNFFCGI